MKTFIYVSKFVFFFFSKKTIIIVVINVIFKMTFFFHLKSRFNVWYKPRKGLLQLRPFIPRDLKYCLWVLSGHFQVLKSFIKREKFLNILTWNGCNESEQIPDFSFTIENSTFSISQIFKKFLSAHILAFQYSFTFSSQQN